MPSSRTSGIRATPNASCLVWIPAVTFILVLASAIFVAKVYDDDWHEDQASAGAELATAYALAIERNLTRSLSAAYILGSMVRLHDLDTADFEAHARDLIRSTGGIGRLMLAPGGVISQVYPAAKNEPWRGQNILEDAERRPEAYLAVVTERLTLAGPVVDAEGAAVVVGTYPVFRNGARGEEQFWGFVLVEIRVDRVIVDSGIPQLTDKGYSYKLSQVDPDSGKSDILAGAREEDFARPISYYIPLPNKHWLLTIMPHEEQAHGPLFALLLAIALMVSTWVASTVFVLLRQPVLLRRVVAERTQQLEAENRERRLAELRARESERRFQHLAQHDELTGLPNRLLFRDRLEQSLLHARRNKTLVALMFVNLDNFKPVNDALGHDAGDLLLRQVAERLPKCVRSSDTVARIGGDEFTVILSGIHSPAAAARVARKIVSALSSPFNVQGRTIRVGCSLGIALFPHHGSDAERLMRSADLAMYRAKDQGRGEYQFADNKDGEFAVGDVVGVERARATQDPSSEGTSA